METSKIPFTYFALILLASTFSGNENVFFGDYTNVTAHNNVVRPIWTRLVGNSLSVWTALISPDVLVDTEVPEEHFFGSMDAAYPNPFVESTAISFKLHSLSLVNLQLFDLRGQVVATLLQDQWMDYGKHIQTIDTKALGLTSGAYVAVLTVDGKIAKQKMLKF